MMFLWKSNIEFKLHSIFEWSLICQQVVAVNSYWSFTNILEDYWWEPEGKRSTWVGANASFDVQLMLGELVFENCNSFIEDASSSV